LTFCDGLDRASTFWTTSDQFTAPSTAPSSTAFTTSLPGSAWRNAISADASRTQEYDAAAEWSSAVVAGGVHQFISIIQRQGNGFVALCPDVDIASRTGTMLSIIRQSQLARAFFESSN